jgi:uncharacterized protein (DUF302 family)
VTDAGLIIRESTDCYAATIARLDAALRARGITPALRLDHAAAAAQVGLKLPPLLLMLFGDPSVGTILMQEDPTTGIDLPLKLLVWEGAEGKVCVGYNDPDWIRARHRIEGAQDAAAKMTSILGALASSAAGRPQP